MKELTIAGVGLRACGECRGGVPDDMDFCPRCGASCGCIRAATADKIFVPYGTAVDPEEYENMLNAGIHNTTKTLLLMWVVLSTFVGFAAMLYPAEVMDPASSAYTQTQVMAIGLVLSMSGVFALVSVVFCIRKVRWKFAVYTCMAAAAVPFSLLMIGETFGILLALVGFMVALRISKEKVVFTS